MVSTAVAMARGMLRRGLSVSSPREAAPSKPPNERSPKTAARATVPRPTPLGGVKGGEREALTARSRAGEHPGKDDHDHDQRDGDPLHSEQRAGCHPDVPVRY